MKLRLPQQLVAALVALSAAAYGDVYTIESGTEISLSALPAGTTSVTGSGTLNLGTGKSLGSITLDAGWEGTVKISNTSFGGDNLNSLAISSSVLELSGITGGHLSQWNGNDNNSTTANIRLTNGSDNSVAWIYSNGAGGSVTWNVFSGSWSGSGTFKKTGGYKESFRWLGDISEWNGKFVTASTAETQLEIRNNAAIHASFENAGTAAMSLKINNSAIGSGVETSFSGNISNTSTGSSTLTASTNAATVTFSGTLSGLSSITLDGRAGNASNILDIAKLETAANGTTLATAWHGGTFKLGALSGEGNLTLQMDAASTVQARLYINGAGSKAFTGDIILYKRNSSGADRSGVVVLNHESVAQNSVFITKSESNTATLALGVNVSNAKLAGINDDAQMGPNHLTIYSGAENKNNSVTNTLELTGSGTYSTAATLQNVNLKMSGTGTQAFTGDLSGFTGSVAINSGAVSLGNSNASTQLTIAGDVSGNGTLYFHGGSVKYTGTATNKGGVVIQDGATVEISGDNFLGTSVTVNSGANLRFQRKNTSNKGTYIENVNADRITLAGGTILGILNDEGNVTNTVADLNVTAASVIQEEHWASHWNISKLTGEGDLTWRAWSNNTASSVMKISGDGAYSGMLTVDGRSATNGWSGSGYKYFSVLEVASADALQSAVVNLDGKNEKNILSLALNNSTVNVAGLKGTEHSIIYSGAAASDTKATPAGDGTTRTLSINTAAKTEYEFAGELKSGITLIKEGEGSQTFSGDLNGFNGMVKANGGTLILENANATPSVTFKGIFVNSGVLELSGGQYTVGSTNTDDGLFADGNHALTGALVLSNGANLTVNAKNWWRFQVNSGKDAGVYIKGQAAGENGAASELSATLQDGGQVSFHALDSASKTGAHIITNTGNGNSFAVDQDYITVEDAEYSINYGATAKTVENRILNSALTNKGTGKLTTINSANTLVGVYAESGSIEVRNAANSARTLESIKANGGDVTMKDLGDAVTANLNELFIADNRTVSMYQGSDTATEANISVSGTLTAKADATLNANLTLNNGATLAVAEGGLHMGSTLTIAKDAKVNLSPDIISGLNSLTVGNGLTLFSGVDAFTIGGSSYDAVTTYHASDYFYLAGVNRPWDFVIQYNANAATDGGTVSLWMETPEPATATLSLLALAALAARRKRK